MTRRAASDRRLADAVLQQGDEQAFRELYRRHTPRLHAFTLRLLGGAEADAEDVVQETWLRAAGALADFRWSSKLETWLTGIALNLCREVFRRRNRRPETDWWDGAAPALPAAPHEDRVDLERAIAALPDGYRSVLVLHDVEGFTHEQIGARLGIAPGTSKSQLFHARRAVRTALEPAVMEGTG
ncbi:MAG: RNA polymerase sigma factor [Gemmatimonadota bacterium]